MRREIIVSSFALLLLAPSQGSAQSLQSFSDLPLRLNLDDRVRIEDRSGARATGRLTHLTRDDIAVQDEAMERRFTSDTVREVAVRHHPLGKGAMIGAAAFALLGAVVCLQREESSGGCTVAGPLGAAAIGAGVGVIVGTLVFQMRTIYRARPGGLPDAQPRAGARVQPSLLEDLALRVNLDDRLKVEDRSGTISTGRLTRLTDDTVTIKTDTGERQFTREAIREVGVRRRPMHHAVLIGAGAGAASGVIAACTAEDREECPDAWLIGAGLGAGAGLAVGALIHKTTVVYPEPGTRALVAPAIARGSVGVRVSVIW